MESKKTKEVFEWLVCILIALIIVALIKTFVGFPTVVSGESMDSTLQNGQRLWISRIGIKINKYPNRGDIITFEAPDSGHLYQSKVEADLNYPVAKYNEKKKNIAQKAISAISIFGKTDFVKRVIGLPGDHVQIKDGAVFVNGQKLDEPYLNPGTVTDSHGGMFIDIVVPDGYVYVLGDNRNNSTDSRMFGCIPTNKIEGRAVWRFWPLNKWKVLKK